MTSRAAAIVLMIAGLAACGRKSDLVPSVPPPATLDQYTRIINAQAASNHVPPGLIGAIIAVESHGNAHATGPSGTMGLMQLKRATAEHYGVSDLYNPSENIAAGTRYLRDLLDRFHGNVTFAVAAYKTGPRAVTEAHGIPASANTYVERVMSLYNAIQRGETAR